MEHWQLLPITELKPGDLVEDPRNGAVWPVEHVQRVGASMVRVRAGAYSETGGPTDTCVVLRKADQ